MYSFLYSTLIMLLCNFLFRTTGTILKCDHIHIYLSTFRQQHLKYSLNKVISKIHTCKTAITVYLFY